MAEIGKLSSETDSKLIASTLMALKDIVAVEASSGESQFMTGSVETSSFGTFAISVDDQSKLIVSYVISADQGSTVQQSNVPLVQSICTNLGKQLSQYAFISQIASSGAPIHRSTLIQSYLNACTVVKLEQKIENDKRLVRKGIQQTINDLLDNTEEMLELYDYILGSSWKKDEDRWVAGFLTQTQRDRIIEGVAYHVLFLLANERTLALLYSPDPRYEHKRIQEILRKEIQARMENPMKNIIKQVGLIKEEDILKFISTIPTTMAHSYESLVFREFVRKIVIEIIQSEPLIIFSSPARQPIREKFTKILPNLEINHMGSILTRALVENASGQGEKYAGAFFEGFIQEMNDVPITKPAMDILVGFCQQFMDSTDLIIAVKALPNIKRKSEITKMIPTGDIKQLRVGSIEEAVILTNAAANAVVNVLANLIIDQFLFANQKIGVVVNDFIEFYRKSGPIIKTASILVSLMEMLADSHYEVDLTIPSARDFLVSSLLKNRYKMLIGDKPVSLKNKENGYALEGKDISKTIDKSIADGDQITLIMGNEKQITIGFDKVDAHSFINLIDDADILINSIDIAVERRFREQVIGAINAWLFDMNRILQKLFEAYETDKKFTSATISSYKPKIPPSSFSKITLGKEVDEILAKANDDIQNAWKIDVINEFEEIVKEVKSKGEVKRKNAKKILKMEQNLEKSIVKIKKNALDEFQKIQKQVTKVISTKKNELKLVLQPPYNEIMAFNYASEDFLPKKEIVVQELIEFASTIEGLREEDYEQIVLNVSLSLFENPPDTVYEPAYNEIISGKRSRAVKQVLGEVKTKRDFERVLKDRGQTFSTEIYSQLSNLINQINRKYIDADGVVTSDGGKANLHIGRLPVSTFPRKGLLEKILNYPHIEFTRETTTWLVSFEIFESLKTQSGNLTIVTFEDAVRLHLRNIFTQRNENIFKALAKVAALIEARAENNIVETFNNLQETMYSA